jgi:phosphate transport system ATP-binding protein
VLDPAATKAAEGSPAPSAAVAEEIRAVIADQSSTRPAVQPEPDVPPRLSAVHVTAYYGATSGVRGVNLAFQPNTVTALIGPSGCGKSTFLRTLNRMHELVADAHVEGQVLLDGHDIYEPDVSAMAVRRKIGMVFQKPTPFPTMSIRENVAAGLKVRPALTRAQMAETVERALRHAALWDEVKDRLDQPATDLSGGQQQRLCVARTLAPQPEVILLDEPTASLDPVGTLRIEELIHELKKAFTIVIVTHNMTQAARVSDRTAFFYLGELIEVGPTGQMFTAPAKAQTEAYVTGRFG